MPPHSNHWHGAILSHGHAAAAHVSGFKVTVVYFFSRRLFLLTNGGLIISMYSGLTNELDVRKESEMGLILLSGDENMCIVDTDSKIQVEECWKVIKIHLSLTNGHVENNHSIFLPIRG